jgi:NitT/TauT family transport system substrate-binding protein
MANGVADNFAVGALNGVPIQVIGTLTRANIASVVVRKDSGINKLADLKGKTMAVPTATGAGRMTSLFLSKFHGIELGKDVNVLNVSNPALGLTFMEAGRADAAMAWEPSVSISMHRDKNLRVLTNLEEMYKHGTGNPLYYYVLAVRSEVLKKNPEVAARIIAAFAEAGRDIERNPEEAVEIAARTIKVDKLSILEGIKSGRVSFDVRPTSDPEVVARLRFILDFLTEHKVLKDRVPDSFFFKP